MLRLVLDRSPVIWAHSQSTLARAFLTGGGEDFATGLCRLLRFGKSSPAARGTFDFRTSFSELEFGH